MSIESLKLKKVILLKVGFNEWQATILALLTNNLPSQMLEDISKKVDEKLKKETHDADD